MELHKPREVYKSIGNGAFGIPAFAAPSSEVQKGVPGDFLDVKMWAKLLKQSQCEFVRRYGSRPLPSRDLSLNEPFHSLSNRQLPDRRRGHQSILASGFFPLLLPLKQKFGFLDSVVPPYTVPFLASV